MLRNAVFTMRMKMRKEILLLVVSLALFRTHRYGGDKLTRLCWILLDRPWPERRTVKITTSSHVPTITGTSIYAICPSSYAVQINVPTIFFEWDGD